MKVGIWCEESATVREAFRKRGHDAVSCDLVASRVAGPHIIGNCLDQDAAAYDIIIAHPPCTYLCNSGVRWLWNPDGTKNTDRWEKMTQACWFFRRILGLRPKIGLAVENPVMHKHAMELIGVKYAQTVQPWMFGDGECKRTCLWLVCLPPLVPTNVVAGRGQSVHRCSPGADRARIRSTTFPGIAAAMASQWGSL